MSETISDLQDALDRHRAGDTHGADALYREVLRRTPEHPTALHLLGLLQLGHGDAVGAMGLLRRAVAQRPAHAALRRALADACAAAGELVEAAAEYATALASWDDPAMRAARAMVLLRIDEPAEALREAEAAMAAEPGIEQRVALGAALRVNHRAAEAAAVLRPVVAEAPDNAAAWISLGHAESMLGRVEAAVAALRRAVAIASDAEGFSALGLALAEAGSLTEAETMCAEAVRRAPGDATAAWAHAWVLLLRGEYGRGLSAYEARKRHPRFARDFPRLPGLEWRRGDLHGKRLLVRAEQGLGDTIQFARYITLLAARGARVILHCAPALVPLLAQLPARVIAKSAPLPEYDLWVDQMSLPRLFGTTTGNIPMAEGYLNADAARAVAWRRRLPAYGTLVGLAWAGNPAHGNDRRRSLPPSLLASLVRMPGIAPVSLQVGPGSGCATAELGLTDMGALLGDFADTAAMIEGLDLVISVDTAVAHLAAAMGKPVWLLLPHAPDWRWMTRRRDTVWYESMRLFRQPAPGDWASVIENVAAALAERQSNQLVNAVATEAATPVAKAPHIISTMATSAENPWMVARFVRS